MKNVSWLRASAVIHLYTAAIASQRSGRQRNRIDYYIERGDLIMLKLVERIMNTFELDEIQILTLISSGALEMSMIAHINQEPGEAAYFKSISDVTRDIYLEEGADRFT